MKLALQYLNVAEGHINAVQISILEWKKLMAKMEKYEVALHVKSLETALREAQMMSKSKKKKQLFSEFLNEL
jgi:hypothetical protein